MRTFKADDQLSEILIRNGFSDFTDTIDKKKGKRRFKTSLSSNKSVKFDYINIQVLKNSILADEKITLSENDLRALLFYFKTSSASFQLVVPSKEFDFKNVTEEIDSWRDRLSENNPQRYGKGYIEKRKPVLEIYDNIQID